MYLRHHLLLLLLVFCSITAIAQVPLTVAVQDSRKAPVPYASVRIVAFADSSKAQERVTDSNGRARFELPAPGAYKVSASSVGYAEVQKALRLTEKPATFTLTLEGSAGTTLGTVVVTSNRPLIRQEDDKTIVDPENLAATSTNAYELIEKTPGLFMDQDGNIYLNSTTPATVHINGREQKMSTADVATMLKNLPPNAISRIEILRTPSARYDASGSGGIVNVVLRKGVKPGLTGSVNAGANQGRYGNQFVGLSLNNNGGRLQSYINLQFSRRDSYEELQSQRFFRPDSVLRQSSFTRYPGETYYTGFGLSYALTKRWDLNWDGRLSINRTANRSTNRSEIAAASTGGKTADNEAIVANSGRNWSLVQGLSAKYRIDSAGSEWTTDLSVTHAPNRTEQDLRTVFLLPAGPENSFDGLIDNKLTFFSTQSNVLKKLSRNWTLEGGLKTTAVDFRNSTTYRRSNAYRYRESIHAAYFQASKKMGAILVKAGTRVENTNMNGRQLAPDDTSFRLQRTDLFPYIYVSRDIMKIMGYQLRAYLVYRRSISRPAYEYLNPYPRIIDPYLQESGNPSLRPQFTQNYEANISVDERPIIALGFNDTKDIFTQVLYQPDSNSRKVAYRTYDNLGRNREFYFRALGAIPPGKRYFLVAGVQYNRNFYEGLYEGAPLSFRRGSWTIFSYQTFKISPLTQLTLNGFVRMNGQIQFYELSTFGSLNLSVTQQLFKKKLALTLSGNDLLYTNNNRFTLVQGTVNAGGERRSDTRRFGINLRYQFGIRKKEETPLLNLESPER
ncbi:outer membrane beta-barrel protein [Flaviaesturariibacter amylovorans]|uniref:Outer membrane beta-barrel family protein n=1 Tax=Flaviaesturariibacter amylovorans TaxID=1084520 RepID=A0ABP8GGR8_9BACT